MKLDIRDLVLFFFLSRADIRYLCGINDGYFFVFLFLLWLFQTFRQLNIFPFFKFIVQFYFSSVKLPHDLCSLPNTVDIWVSMKIVNWGFVVLAVFQNSFWQYLMSSPIFLGIALLKAETAAAFVSK